MKNLILLILSLTSLNSCTNRENTSNTLLPVEEKDTIIIVEKTNQNFASKAFLQDNNVYVVFNDGTKKQLTFNQTDIDPILLPNKAQIVYVRNQNFKRYQTKIIMLVNISDLKESVLSDQKPYIDGQEGTSEILSINNAELSLDGEYLLFITEKYATGHQLVKVNLKTGIWTELFTAELFEQINKKPYFGYFLVGQSVIEDRGRDVYYRLVNGSGEIVKKFNDLESMKSFRNSIK